MNKELPSIVRQIFTYPDPVIWHGFWLEYLEVLLQSKDVLVVWDRLISQMENNHQYNRQLSLNKYLKWELKAFVAITIKNFKSANNKKEFSEKMQAYLRLKKLELEESVIKIIFEELKLL